MLNVTQYCLCFDGEEELPVYWKNRPYERLVWLGEYAATRRCPDNPLQLLSMVAKHLSLKLYGGSRLLAARYIAEYPYCSSAEKSEIIRTHGLEKILHSGRPRGWTLFESRWELEDLRFGGQLLFNDGRIYRMFGSRVPKGNVFYLLLENSRELAFEIKDLLTRYWPKLMKVPSKNNSYVHCSGAYWQFKFFDKWIEGYSVENMARHPAVFSLQRNINRLFAKYGFLIGEDSPYAELENFVARWTHLMDTILTDKTRRNFYEFLKMDFGKECASLGFVMDDSKGFDETALKKVQDFQLLGNEIYNRWKRISRLGVLPGHEFDPRWFKAALNRLEELGMDGND